MHMSDFQHEKNVVREYIEAFDSAKTNDLVNVCQDYLAEDYHWRGMHPFYEIDGVAKVLDTFWMPLRKAFSPIQRREDIFFAGANVCKGNDDVWVVSMGNFLGLFDQPWLGIPPTGKMVFLRYAEFHRVVENKISESALFCDIMSVMDQAGHYPLPPMTGANFIYPGPRTHDGMLLSAQQSSEGQKTMDLVHRMIEDLNVQNKSGRDTCTPETLAKTWHDDMIWYGPTGIGAAYTIRRYQEQHQYPFRENLTDKVFNGHVARFAEGNYCGFFGWPNLNNKNKGGFLGLTANDTHAPMRVVDIYRRSGEKLAENWVFIDLLHYLFVQGLDVLGRMNKMIHKP
jgi:predicted ester cyclase